MDPQGLRCLQYITYKDLTYVQEKHLAILIGPKSL